MRYELTFTEQALQSMAQLSPDLLTFLEARLDELAAAPAPLAPER